MLDDATAEFLRRICELPAGEKLLSCIQCGMCSGVCPLGYAMDYTPRRMISALRAGRIDDLYRSDAIWLCVACFNCTFRCPVGVPIPDRLIASLRVDLLGRGVGVPPELQAAFERTFRYGNPFGESPKKRDAWTRDAGIDVPILREGDSAEVLWWVGCFGSYNKRNQEDTIALARILRALEVDFGILGPDERCSGDLPCTSQGETGLFDFLYHHNAEQLGKRKFKEVLVGDPHAFNAFNKDYRLLGTSLDVRHYTQFLADRATELKRKMKKQIATKVTYHDACCLGRRNGEYEAPRILLETIPSLKLVEMPRNRENALCCGGGGGANWLDSYIWQRTRVPLPMQRVQEAARTGADVLAVSCPLEIPRFEDAIKSSGLDGRLRVREVSHMVAEGLGLLGGT
ncbi:MAG: hypothetical protein A3K68_07125 [Euryarchaeota archaeon RBG_16_68_13]|nr:MAG: hypothetical protein A3K68_07125 [Euryarchaeota archaeon RBG_16_68_13]